MSAIDLFKRIWFRRRNYLAQSDYLQPSFLRAIGRRRIRTIFELGSCGGEDARRLQHAFRRATIYSFECNPLVLPSLRARLAGEPRVRLVDRAVWDADGRIPFHPVVRATQDGRAIDNPGASSCFLASADYRQQYVQDTVDVEAVRLDTFCAAEGIGGPDLLCIDVQGAALRALRGLGARIADVSAIIIEIERRPIYLGQDLYPEIDGFLVAHGFRQAVEVRRDDWFSDFLYLRDA